MKIEYGKAWSEAKNWFLSIMLKAKHHDKWMADGYGYLGDVIKEHYAPQVTAEVLEQARREVTLGDRIQIPLNQGDESERDIIPLARHKFLDKVDEDWKDDD